VSHELLYEAGPCGYGLHRLLSGCGHDWVVVAPSLIPIRAVARVKTDRRHTMMRDKLHRAGELTPIWIPDVPIKRCATPGDGGPGVVQRSPASAKLLAAPRPDLSRVRAWTLAYRRWLTTVRFAHSAQQIVLQDYIHVVQDAEARFARPTRQIEELLPSRSMAPVVTALRGCVASPWWLPPLWSPRSEIFDASPMPDNRWPIQAWCLPNIHPAPASGAVASSRPAIYWPSPRPGNILARRVRIEGAWTYRRPARVSCKLHDRNEKLSPVIRDIAWKAQTRLCYRYRRLAAAGKPKVVVAAAIAREMVGFIWAIAQIAQSALSALPKLAYGNPRRSITGDPLALPATGPRWGTPALS
jgi:hypothetical protein